MNKIGKQNEKDLHKAAGTTKKVKPGAKKPKTEDDVRIAFLGNAVNCMTWLEENHLSLNDLQSCKDELLKLRTGLNAEERNIAERILSLTRMSKVNPAQKTWFKELADNELSKHPESHSSIVAYVTKELQRESENEQRRIEIDQKRKKTLQAKKSTVPPTKKRERPNSSESSEASSDEKNISK